MLCTAIQPPGLQDAWGEHIAPYLGAFADGLACGAAGMRSHPLARAFALLAIGAFVCMPIAHAAVRGIPPPTTPPLTPERREALETAAADSTLPSWQRDFMRGTARGMLAQGAAAQSRDLYGSSPQVVGITNTAGAWSELAPAGTLPSVRYGATAIYDPVRDRMVVFGGYSGTDRNDSWALTLSGSPAWTALAPSGNLPPGRAAHAAIYDPVRDRILVFAGFDGTSRNDLWALTLSGIPAWMELAPSGNLPPARYYHTAIYDPVRDRMVVFGGVDPFVVGPTVYYNDVWALTLSGNLAWSEMTPLGSLPAGRYGHTAVYDPVRDRMVVFGGYGDGIDRIYRNDVWALVLSEIPAWSSLAASGSPPPERTSHTAIYDPTRDRMVVFGGQSGSVYRNDVWALTLSGGPAWGALAPTGRMPMARYAHTAIYDPVRDRMVMFSGFYDTGNFDNDAWTLMWGAISTSALFGPKTDYPTGNSPQSVAIEDLNGNGAPDLVVTNSGSNTVSVLLGNGGGTFGMKTDYGTGGGPSSVAIGDLNGDGKLDLAVANYYSSTLSVLLGIGNGTFGTKAEYGTGSDPASVTIGELNGDGKPDLAVTNFHSSSVSVLLGNGDGTVGARTAYGTGGNPLFVAIGDLNADGKQDLAVANGYSNTVSVLLGNGDGTVGAKTDYGTGSGPKCVAIADLNADGKPDLAVANDNSSTVSVLLGNGDGTFGAATDYGTGSCPLSVAIGDLNGDGKPDLAVANYCSSTVSVLLGNGNGKFGTKTDYVAGSGPSCVAVGDLSGDGKPDLVVANIYSNTVSVLLNASNAISLVSVSSGLTVSPSVVYASPGPGVNNFSVNFTLSSASASPYTFAEVAVAILDANNNFLFDLAPPNLTNVTVPANGSWTYPPRSGYLVNSGTYKAVVRGRVAGGNWFDLPATGGGVNPRTFTVLPALTGTSGISGVVTVDGPAHSPIEGATVRWSGYTATTFPDGSFSLPSLPCETHDLLVSKTGFENGLVTAAVDCTVGNQAQGPVQRVLVPLRTAKAILTGVVYGVGHVPVAGAAVRLQSGAQQPTDAGGHFRFEGVDCKPSWITVTAPGYQTGSEPVTGIQCGGLFTFDVSLTRGSTIVSGTVTDKVNHRPVYNAKVVFGNTPTSTDLDGNFSFGAQPCGQPICTRFTVEGSGYVSYGATVSPCSGSGPMDIRLVPAGMSIPERVILVHGICSDEGIWSGLTKYLLDMGYDVRSFSYPNTDRPGGARPVANLAKVIGRSAVPVHIVAHSMGGLVARSYLRKYGNPGGHIKTLVTLATPHHGADIPLAAQRQLLMLNPEVWTVASGGALLDLCPPKALITQTMFDMIPTSPYLNDLNYGPDESRWERKYRRYSWQQNQNVEVPYPGVRLVSIAGTAGLLQLFRNRIGYDPPAAVYDDGAVSTSGARFAAGDNYWDSDLGVGGTLKHNSGALYAPGVAIYESPAVWERIVQIIKGIDPPPVAHEVSIARSIQDAAQEDSQRELIATSGILQAGERLELPVALPAQGQLRAVIDCENCAMTMVGPSGRVHASVSVSTDTLPGSVGPSSQFHEVSVDTVESGIWRVLVDALPPDASHGYGLHVALLGVPEPITSVSETRLDPGQLVTVTAQDSMTSDHPVTAWFVALQSGGSSVQELALQDDGLSSDQLAGDGMFSGSFVAPSEPGVYNVAFQGVSAEGGSVVAYSPIEVVRRGDVRPDPSLLAADVVSQGVDDSLEVRVVLENASPFALDEVQVQLWQEGMDLADSVFVPMAPWQRDTLVLPWRVNGSGPAVGFVSVSTAGLDEDTTPLNNTLRFTYSDGVVSVDPLAVSPRIEFYAQGYPNPAMGAVAIRFGLPVPGPVSLRVFDVAGRTVAILVNGELPAGDHVARWDRGQTSGGKASAGVYFYDLRAGSMRTVKRLIILR